MIFRKAYVHSNILDFLYDLTTQLRNMQMEDVAIVTDDKEIDNLICDKYKIMRFQNYYY